MNRKLLFVILVIILPISLLTVLILQVPQNKAVVSSTPSNTSVTEVYPYAESMEYPDAYLSMYAVDYDPLITPINFTSQEHIGIESFASETLALNSNTEDNLSFCINDTTEVTFLLNQTQFPNSTYQPPCNSEYGGSIVSGTNESLYYHDNDNLTIFSTSSAIGGSFILTIEINVSDYADFITNISYKIVFTNNDSTGALAVWLVNATDKSSCVDRMAQNYDNLTGVAIDSIDFLLALYNNSDPFGTPYSANSWNTFINGTKDQKKVSDAISDEGIIMVTLLGIGHPIRWDIDVFNFIFFYGNFTFWNYTLPYEDYANMIESNRTYVNGSIVEPDAIYGKGGWTKYIISLNLTRFIYDYNMSVNITISYCVHVYIYEFSHYSASVFPGYIGSYGYSYATYLYHYFSFYMCHYDTWIYTNITYILEFIPPDSKITSSTWRAVFTSNTTETIYGYYSHPITLKLMTISGTKDFSDDKPWCFYQDYWVGNNKRNRTYLIKYFSNYNLPLWGFNLLDQFLRKDDVDASKMPYSFQLVEITLESVRYLRFISTGGYKFKPDQYIPITITYSTRASLDINVWGKSWLGQYILLKNVNLKIVPYASNYVMYQGTTSSSYSISDMPFGAFNIEYSSTLRISGSEYAYIDRNSGSTINIYTSYAQPWYFIFLEWWMIAIIGSIAAVIIIYFVIKYIKK